MYEPAVVLSSHDRPVVQNGGPLEAELGGGLCRGCRWKDGRDALTSSEFRVTRLAAEGRTNSEIAQLLFITPRTVETHLTSSYAKLGIRSRRELAGTLDPPGSG